MFKIGDKVETPLGRGKIVTIEKYNKEDGPSYMVVINNSNELGFTSADLKLYKSAHEKLLEYGFKIEIDNDEFISLIHPTKNYFLTIYKLQKTYYIDGAIGLELTKILKQYLEEME